MLDSKGNVKIIDFGLSKAFDLDWEIFSFEIFVHYFFQENAQEKKRICQLFFNFSINDFLRRYQQS